MVLVDFWDLVVVFKIVLGEFCVYPRDVRFLCYSRRNDDLGDYKIILYYYLSIAYYLGDLVERVGD